MPLDGMPGDRNSPEFAAATEAWKLLAPRCVPLVLCSNRTRAEIERIQEDLGIVHPFISENGAALFVPEGYFAFAPPGARRQGFEVVEFGWPYPKVVEALHATATSLGIQVVGFSDMSIDDVARECGLSLSQARLAKLREYDEPFRILDHATPARQSRFFTALRRVGLRCGGNGLYRHVTGLADTRESVRVAISLYRQKWGDVLTIGLGAQVDDVSLLQEVEIPVVVQGASVDVTARMRPIAKLLDGQDLVDRVRPGHPVNDHA